MRVLVLALYHSATGGIEEYGRLMASTLADVGHTVEVWSALEPRDIQREDPRIRNLAPRAPTLAGAHHRLMAPNLAARLRLHARRFDFVLALHISLASATRYGTKGGRRCPFGVWTYGTDVWGPWPGATTQALRRAAIVGTISRYTAATIRQRVPDLCPTVIPPAVVVGSPRLDITDREEPTLLSVSRITSANSYKGHDVVIAALPKVQRLLSRPVRYRIVGSGEGLNRLRRLADQVGVGDRVDFLGRLGSRQLQQEYSACDVFVLPSRMVPNGYGSWTGEGFGIAYLEAAAAGKPVVASIDGGAPEAISHGVSGLAVDPRNPEAVATACADILGNPEAAREMGDAGRRLVESEFSPSVFANGVSAMLESID